MIGNHRIQLAVLVVITTALALSVIGVSWGGAPGPETWFWLAACIVGELLWIRLPLGNATLSMASCFNLAALLVLQRGEAVVATSLASLAVELFFMRKPPVRAIFNAAHTTLAVFAASVTFGVLAGGSGDLVAMISHLQVLPFVAAAFVYYLLNRAAVSLAVALSEGVSVDQAWIRNFGNAYELFSSGAVFSLGVLLAIHHVLVGMGGTLLVVLPLILAFDGYRRHARRRAEVLPREGRAA